MNRLVIIHIDGFSYEYMNNIPYLRSLLQEGLARRMEPSIFFQANISSYTGRDVNSHKRIVEYIYDPENSPFTGLRKAGVVLDGIDRYTPYILQKYSRYIFSYLYTTFFRRPPVKFHFIPFSLAPYFKFSFNNMYIMGNDIFTRAKKAGLKTAWDDEDFTYNIRRRWMGTYFYRFYPGAMSEWGIEKIKKGVELIWVDLGAELDRCGHKYGPDASMFIDVLRKISLEIKKLIGAAERYSYNFIIFSDHGMESVKSVVNIDRHLRERGLINGRDYIGFYDSTLVRFWGMETVIQKIKEILVKEPHGKYIEKKDCLEIGLPLNGYIGQAIFAVEQGGLILPNFYQGNKSVKGMHGYLEKREGPLDGIFISNVTWNSRRAKGSDIAALTCRILGIE